MDKFMLDIGERKELTISVFQISGKRQQGKLLSTFQQNKISLAKK